MYNANLWSSNFFKIVKKITIMGNLIYKRIYAQDAPVCLCLSPCSVQLHVYISHSGGEVYYYLSLSPQIKFTYTVVSVVLNMLW